MKLKVLAGAKQGTEIPLKKNKFIIGRASDCTLRAGSEAISRHHCALLRRDGVVSVRDLGSRNGTYVNDKRIESETKLANGDKVRVGPLEFVFECAAEPAAKRSGGDSSHEKKPKVKDVAEALERTAENSDSATIEEDDISSWLLGPDAGSKALNETQTFRMDDTHAVAKVSPSEQPSLIPSEEAEDGGDADTGEDGESADEESDKKKGKKEPGKLPKLPSKPTAKDSREAAADILRELARRR